MQVRRFQHAINQSTITSHKVRPSGAAISYSRGATQNGNENSGNLPLAPKGDSYMGMFGGSHRWKR